MKASKTKTTVLALIALIIVCGGSFIGVKLLNNTNAVSTVVTTLATTLAPQTLTSATTTTAAPTTSEPALVNVETMPLATTAATTKEIASEAAEEDEIDQFSTFAVSQNAATEKKEDAESTDPTTTTGVITTTAAASSPNDIQINSEEDAQQLIDDASRASKGFAGYLYDAAGNFFYTSDDPWQRQFGFNELFDAGAPFVAFYYDTMRCKFRYDKKDWMIQFWKGQYGWVFVGCEVGVYYKPTDRKVEHYDCVPDEDTLKMSLTFHRKGKQVAEREYARYWWCTAFVPGVLDKFSDRSELEVRVRITMKDQVMLLGFCNALKKNGYTLNRNFTVNGLDVFVVY